MRSLLICRSGVAAAEMVLVLPILMILLFGSVEVGKYFMDEHIVVKAVRDGARYAARQPMTNFVTSEGGCQSKPLGDVEADTMNIVRTGNRAGIGKRLHYWVDSDTTITVTVACFAKAGPDDGDQEDMAGIYSGMSHNGNPVGAPVVTVTAQVPYSSLFGLFGFGDLSLNATQQAAVMGV